jgi:hypothetical protein
MLLQVLLCCWQLLQPRVRDLHWHLQGNQVSRHERWISTDGLVNSCATDHKGKGMSC